MFIDASVRMFGKTNQDYYAEERSVIPLCSVPGEGKGLAYNLRANKIIRFEKEDDLAASQDKIIVIRDSEGKYRDPQSYIGQNGVPRSLLNKALRKGGGLNLNHVLKLYAKQQEVCMVRPSRVAPNVIIRRVKVG